MATITDPDGEDCLAWELQELPQDAASHWTDRVRDFLHDRPVLTAKPWPIIKAHLIQTDFSLIPKEYFNANAKLPYYRTTAHFDELIQTLDYSEVKAFDHFLAFAYPKKLAKNLKMLFPESKISFEHAAQGMLTSAKALAQDAPNLMGIALHGHTLTAIALEDGQLRYCNIFRVSTAMDAVYYALLMMEELGRNPRSATLQVWGTVEAEDSTLLKALSKYIENPVLGERYTNLKLTHDYDELPDHVAFGTLVVQ